MIYMMANEEDTMIDEIITNDEVDEITRAEQLARAKISAKPLIDHLKDAVDTDEHGNIILLAKVGDKIIIERIASILTHKPWLDTKTYIITNVDRLTGDLILLDNDLHQQAGSNYIAGIKQGYRFKLPTSKGMSIGKRKRGRPRKNPTDAPELAKPVQLDAAGLPIVKKRGRPAGIKNRSKDVIHAEKRAKLDLRSKRKSKSKSKVKSKSK